MKLCTLLLCFPGSAAASAEAAQMRDGPGSLCSPLPHPGFLKGSGKWKPPPFQEKKGLVVETIVKGIGINILEDNLIPFTGISGPFVSFLAELWLSSGLLV